MTAVRLALALAIASFVVPSADAQTVSVANPAKIFAAVDAVSMYPGNMAVTGVLQGEAAPSTWLINLGATATATYDLANTCQRAAYLAMSRPGGYLLEIYNGTATTQAYCKLTRVTP
jgi:hypothetical protein